VDGSVSVAAPRSLRLALAAARWLDRNVERAIMAPLYAFIALLIGGEGILRYLTSTQSQWGGAMAIHAFIFLSWVGCAYHVRHRSHLCFDGIRKRLPPRLRLAACVIDDAIWLLLAAIIVYYSWGLVSMQAMLGNTVEGTDSVPLSLATATVPASWLLIGCRAVQDLVLLARDRKPV
jgi:TRAP-type C4-dicarboxylate transport system permease small subunit